MKPFSLKIITPAETLLEEQATSIIAPGPKGYVGIWANHAPFITSLLPGTLTIKHNESEKRFSIQKGFLEVLDNQVKILTELAS